MSAFIFFAKPANFERLPGYSYFKCVLLISVAFCNAFRTASSILEITIQDPAKNHLNHQIMKHSRKCLSIATAGLALAASQPMAEAATVIVPLQTAIVSDDSFDIIFADPVNDVLDLVMISDGSVNTQEGGSITISAILGDNSEVQLYSGNLSFNEFQTPISSFTNNNFTDFPDPVSVKGLSFKGVGQSGVEPRFTLPSSTTFTFAVPEPSSALLSMVGLSFLGLRRSRS
jgi:hypothetical protein